MNCFRNCVSYAMPRCFNVCLYLNWMLFVIYLKPVRCTHKLHSKHSKAWINFTKYHFIFFCVFVAIKFKFKMILFAFPHASWFFFRLEIVLVGVSTLGNFRYMYICTFLLHRNTFCFNNSYKCICSFQCPLF